MKFTLTHFRRLSRLLLADKGQERSRYRGRSPEDSRWGREREPWRGSIQGAQGRLRRRQRERLKAARRMIYPADSCQVAEVSAFHFQIVFTRKIQTMCRGKQDKVQMHPAAEGGTDSEPRGRCNTRLLHCTLLLATLLNQLSVHVRFGRRQEVWEATAHRCFIILLYTLIYYIVHILWLQSKCSS